MFIRKVSPDDGSVGALQWFGYACDPDRGHPYPRHPLCEANEEEEEEETEEESNSITAGDDGKNGMGNDAPPPRRQRFAALANPLLAAMLPLLFQV